MGCYMHGQVRGCSERQADPKGRLPQLQVEAKAGTLGGAPSSLEASLTSPKNRPKQRQSEEPSGVDLTREKDANSGENFVLPPGHFHKGIFREDNSLSLHEEEA